MAIDAETRQLLGEQDLIRQIVSHDGWKYIRQRFLDKLLDLQNSFNIDTTKTPTTIARELSINKKAHEVLTEFWQNIEGTAAEAVENKDVGKDKSYIVDLDRQV